MSERHIGADARLGVSVPANLLLMGEYAVLEEGGKGVALALDYRARGELVRPRGAPGGREAPSPATSTLTITGALPTGPVVWPGDSGILGRVADYLCERLGAIAGSITVDTAAFYTRDGRKRGFGSSAAVTVALTALWCAASGPRPDDRRVRTLATEAHRAAQDGRGSGYDVATSSSGGIVAFTGGLHPRAEGVELPWLPPIALFAGRTEVRTTDAVERYHRWREREPNAAERFVSRSNELVERFMEADSWEHARPHFERYVRLSLELGCAIGVSAAIPPPTATSGVVRAYKAVGAGNELGIALLNDPPGDRSETQSAPEAGIGSQDLADAVGEAGALVRTPVAREGIRWV